ncbi:MAG: hypothetical protein GY922_08815 [Proteobacteria bacterium]|nr:hypothetical protein [Pseudomonadota bacterium]
MNTFQNNLGETLPGFMLGIAGTKEAERGWCGLYSDGHSVSPRNARRKLGRTSPLHLRTGWGGKSTAQCKENMLSRPDTICRSGCDAPKNGQLLSFNRWTREIFQAFQRHTVFEIQKCRVAFLNPQ